MKDILLNGFKDIVPCKDCNDRKCMCHVSCEKYKQWKHNHELMKHNVREENKYMFTHNQYVFRNKVLPYISQKRYGIGIHHC